MPNRVGTDAPQFTLPGSDGGAVEEYSLAEFTDLGPTVLAFYLFDFHPHCTEEVCGIRDLEWFTVDTDTQVAAISTDSAYSHQAFAAEYGLAFPLLSDSDGSVAEAFGVRYDDFDGHAGVAKRSVFVVDTDGIIQWAWSTDDPSVLPAWGDVKSALDAVS